MSFDKKKDFEIKKVTNQNFRDSGSRIRSHILGEALSVSFFFFSSPCQPVMLGEGQVEELSRLVESPFFHIFGTHACFVVLFYQIGSQVWPSS